MSTLTGTAAASGPSQLGWKVLAPLPDPIGYGGLFAGVLNGRLVAGGGSQFHDKPLWLKGEKVFTDRIFTLSALDARWVESAARLPLKVGHFVSGATADAVYLAGGIDATGCLRQVWEMRAEGEGFAFRRLTDLPAPVGYGTGMVVRERLYVVGGLSAPGAKIVSRETWSLDLKAPSAPTAWRREPDLPAPGIFVGAAGTDGSDLFIFGGVGFDEAGKAVPSRAAYRLNVTTLQWERLTDLPEPRVAAVTPCPHLNDGRLFVAGGYAEVFPGLPREHPGFSAQTLFFDPATRNWTPGPVLPRTPVADRDSPGDHGPAPMIGAGGAVWQNHFIVIGGEVRASVRTPAVLAWPFPVMAPR